MKTRNNLLRELPSQEEATTTILNRLILFLIIGGFVAGIITVIEIIRLYDALKECTGK